MFLFRDVTLDMRKEIRATLKQIYGIGFLRAFEACSIVGLRYPFSLISWIYIILHYWIVFWKV